jgi:hypothetical protein
MKKFFSYDGDGDGYVTHETAEQARQAAVAALQHEAALAIENGGWGERVGEICWGEIRELAVPVECGVNWEFEECIDYVMKEPT